MNDTPSSRPGTSSRVRELVAHPILGPVGNGVGRRDLEVEAGQRREPTHLAGEPPRMSRVDRVSLQRRCQAQHGEPANRQELLDDLATSQRPGDHAASPVAPGDDLATDRCRVAGRIDRRHGGSVGILFDRSDLRAEADVATDCDQLVAQPGDQFVLRIDVVRPPTCQRAVVEHDAVVRRAELAAVVGRLEVQDGAGDADRLQQLDGAVVDGAGLGHALHVGTHAAFEHHERDALPVQEMGGHETGRTGADDGDGGGSLADRGHVRRVQRRRLAAAPVRPPEVLPLGTTPVPTGNTSSRVGHRR